MAEKDNDVKDTDDEKELEEELEDSPFEQEELDEEVIIEVDMSKMSLDDLEMLSLYEDKREVPQHRLVAFLKRVAGEEVGLVPVTQIGGLIEAVMAQVKDATDPEGENGKN